MESHFAQKKAKIKQMSTSHQILLVEDDAMIARALQMSLPYKGFEVTICPTYRQGIDTFRAKVFDLILLDVNLPDGNGMDLCREIRKVNDSVPVLMLTAKVDEESAVKGLECGADDYIRKPYGVQELTARMLRLLERKTKQSAPLQFGPLKIDLKKRMAWAGESALTLGKREFEILVLLIKKSGDVVTRNDILDTLGEVAEIYDRTIDSHLSHIRRKLKDSGVQGVQITPVYGVGYRLEATEKPQEK
jgi:DNA-binding response OmpR family regulator